jgi:hypothetical protein
MAKQYSQKEVDALLRAASGGDDFEAVVKRPYHTIYGPAGKDGAEVSVAAPPSEGGPWTIGGRHPEDYFAAEKDKDGKYVATQNCGDLPTG